MNISTPHGTNAGHRKHTRVDHDCVCFSCLMAHRKHWRDTRVRRSAVINSKRKEWKLRKLQGLPNPSLRKPPELLSKRRSIISRNGFESYTKQDVIDKWGSDCHVCLRPIDWSKPSHAKYEGWESGGHLDHVVPLSRGGTDTLDNVKPIHALCNLRKGAKLVEELDLNEFIL